MVEMRNHLERDEDTMGGGKKVENELNNSQIILL